MKFILCACIAVLLFTVFTDWKFIGEMIFS